MKYNELFQVFILSGSINKNIWLQYHAKPTQKKYRIISWEFKLEWEYLLNFF